MWCQEVFLLRAKVDCLDHILIRNSQPAKGHLLDVVEITRTQTPHISMVMETFIDIICYPAPYHNANHSDWLPKPELKQMLTSTLKPYFNPQTVNWGCEAQHNGPTLKQKENFGTRYAVNARTLMHTNACRVQSKHLPSVLFMVSVTGCHIKNSHTLFFFFFCQIVTCD